MTRQEFIVSLREGIRKLPPEEIVAATEFYEEYFDEVLETGEKTEEEIIEELGNPKKIAAQIKAEYAARLLDGDESMSGEKPTVKKKLSAVWWVIIGIVSAPVSIPIAIAIATGAFTIVSAIIAGIIGVCGAGISAIAMGCKFMADAASSGIMILGIGLMLLAAAVAAGFAVFLGCRAIVRKITKAVKRRKEIHRRSELNEMRGGGSEWVYASRPDDDEKAFMEEIKADAAEAEAAAGSFEDTIALEAPEELKALEAPAEGGEEND